MNMYVFINTYLHTCNRLKSRQDSSDVTYHSLKSQILNKEKNIEQILKKTLKMYNHNMSNMINFI
jgi:hypothetical protein